MKRLLCCTVLTTVVLGAFSFPSDGYVQLTDKNPFPADVKLPKQSLFGAAVNLDLSKNGSIIPYPLSVNFSTNYETGVGGSGNVIIPLVFPLSAFFGFPPINFSFAFTANKNVTVDLAAEAGSNNTVDSHEIQANGGVTVGSSGWNIPSKPIGWLAPMGWDTPSGWSEPTGWTSPVETNAWTPPTETNAWTPPTETNAWKPPVETTAWTPPAETTGWTPPATPSAWTAPVEPTGWAPPATPSAWTAPVEPTGWTPPATPSAWTAPVEPTGWTPPATPSAWTAPVEPTGWTPPAKPTAWTAPVEPTGWTPPAAPTAWTAPAAANGWNPPAAANGWTPPAATNGWTNGWPQRHHGLAPHNKPLAGSDKPRPSHAYKPVAAPANTENANAAPVPSSVPAAVPAAAPAPLASPEPAPVPEHAPVVAPELVPVAAPEPTPVAAPEPTPVAAPEPAPVAAPEPVQVAAPESNQEMLPSAEFLVQDPLVEHAVDHSSIPQHSVNEPAEHDAAEMTSANFESIPVVSTNEFIQSFNPEPAVSELLAEDDHLKTKVSALLSSNSGKTRRHAGVEQPSALRIEDFEDVEVSQELAQPPSPTSVETSVHDLSHEEMIIMAMEQAQQNIPMTLQMNMPRPPANLMSNNLMFGAPNRPQQNQNHQQAQQQPATSEENFDTAADLRNSETLNSALSKNVPSKMSGEFSKGKPRPYGMDPAKNKPAKTRPTLDMGMKDKDQQFGIPHYSSDFVQKEQAQSNPSSVLGWQLPSINWPSFTNLFQNFIGNRHKLAKSDAEDSAKACVDDESDETIVRSPTIQSGHLCQASSSATLNRCHQACIDNGFASGNCLGPYPTPGCMCRMPNNKEYGLVLSPLDKSPKDENAEDMQVSDKTPCKKCGCTEACKSSGSYMGFCVDKCYCAVPWYTKQE